MTPGETVTEFIRRLTAGQADAAAELCHTDLVFENVPLEPPRQQGRDQILDGLEALIAMCSHVKWEVGFQIETSTSVVNERVDRFWFDDGLQAEVPVLARWEVVEGKITLWRDYYDLTMWNRWFDGGYFSYMQRRATRPSS